MQLLGNNIRKIKPGLVYRQTTANGKKKIEQCHEYGHIVINKQPIRLSTCLNLDANIIQYPIEEQKYFNNGKYIFFTCGDAYLLVNINKLLLSNHHRTTEKKNYEINISSLFEIGAVEKYGLIDFYNETYEDEKGIHNITTTLPEKYLAATLRGCMIAKKPHYILARLENSGSENYFDYELWTNFKDVYYNYKQNITQGNHKSIGLQARKNTAKLLKRDKFEFTNLIGKCPGIITKNKDVHFMIFNYKEVKDIERIRLYCNNVYRKYFKK